MPSFFPCPNNQCTYQFDADILPAAAMVTCPLCRTRFPYRAKKRPPAEAPASPADAAPSGPRVVALRNRPQGARFWSTLLWVGGFTIVLVAIVGAILLRGRNRTDDVATDQVNQQHNVRVQPFPKGWQNETRYATLGNVLSRRRSDPDGFVAVADRVLADREPTPGDIEDLVRKKLGEIITTPTFEPVEGETWSGQSAYCLRFLGDMGDGPVRGEAYGIAYKGIVYGYFCWAPESDWDRAKKELTSLRDRVTLAHFREDYKAPTATQKTFEGEGYHLSDPKGLWIRGAPAKPGRPDPKAYPVDDVKTEVDPAATMAFRARKPDPGRRTPESYAAVVELTAGGGDPIDVVKNHVLGRIKNDYGDRVPEGLRLEPLHKGRPLPSGGPAMARFLFKNPGARDDSVIWIVSAITVGDKVVAVEIRTAERDLAYFEEAMIAFAASLQAK